MEVIEQLTGLSLPNTFDMLIFATPLFLPSRSLPVVLVHGFEDYLFLTIQVVYTGSVMCILKKRLSGITHSLGRTIALPPGLDYSCNFEVR